MKSWRTKQPPDRGGIIGLATAWQLLTLRPGSRVIVVEAEAEVAAHQTSHNSGVLHAGVYYAPGSLKATLCARGRVLMVQFCGDHDIPIDFNGHLVGRGIRGEYGEWLCRDRASWSGDSRSISRGLCGASGRSSRG